MQTTTMKALAVYWCRGVRRSTYIQCTTCRDFLRELAAHERYLERLVQTGDCEGYVILLEGEFSRNAARVPEFA